MRLKGIEAKQRRCFINNKCQCFLPSHCKEVTKDEQQGATGRQQPPRRQRTIVPATSKGNGRRASRAS